MQHMFCTSIILLGPQVAVIEQYTTLYISFLTERRERKIGPNYLESFTFVEAWFL